MLKLMGKRIFVIVCVLALSLPVFAVSAKTTMNSHDYSISGTGDGRTVKLNEQKKEYDEVTVKYNEVRIELWQDRAWYLPDVWHGNNQTLDVGTNQRAWWYGGGAGDYHLYQEVIAYREAPASSSGRIQNYV